MSVLQEAIKNSKELAKEMREVQHPMWAELNEHQMQTDGSIKEVYNKVAHFSQIFDELYKEVMKL